MSNLKNSKHVDLPELKLYIQQMDQTDRKDFEALDYAAYAMNCVSFQIEHPNHSLKLTVPEKPMYVEQGSKWNKIAGIALMTTAVLVGLASIAMIATLKFAPVGVVGVGFAAKLFALGATTYGLTLFGSSMGFFAGNELRRANSTKDISQETVRVMHSVKSSVASN